MNYSLTKTDILNNIKTRVLRYDDLANYKTIDQIFINNTCFILYPIQSKNNGHWVCVLKNAHGVEFFDPYGFFIDTEKKYAHNDDLVNTINYISILMKKSPYELSYNENKFQARDDDIATCGRWCLIRCLMKNHSLNYFKNTINIYKKKYNLTSDELIVIISKYIIKK